MQTRHLNCQSLNNKFIMRVGRQRNPYLKRILSEQPHKYSFDIESGKHFLIDEQGRTTCINKIGTFNPNFRPYYSGFVNHKARYKDAAKDPSVLHFAPDMNFRHQNSYHTPMTDKFAGYAQFPYKLRKQFPTYLRKPNQPAEYPRKKINSVVQKTINKSRQQNNLILQYSTTKFINPKENDHYFNSAYSQMTDTKPLPKQRKKTCYNYKCKFMKPFVFDEKSKIQTKIRFVDDSPEKTLGKSFYDNSLALQMKESKLISTMAFTSAE